MKVAKSVDLKVLTTKINCNCGVMGVLTNYIVIISQHIRISNHYVYNLNSLCFMSVVSQ